MVFKMMVLSVMGVLTIQAVSAIAEEIKSKADQSKTEAVSVTAKEEKGNSAAASDQQKVAPNIAMTDQCMALDGSQFVAASRSAQNVGQLTLKTSTMPGGSTTSVEIPTVGSEKSQYCAMFFYNEPVKHVSSATTEGQNHAFVEKSLHLNVLSAMPIDGTKTTRLTFEVPNPGFGPQKHDKLIVVAFPTDQIGKLKVDAPALSVTQDVLVSSWLFSFAIAVTAVILAYLIAVLSLGEDC